jgi:hypothetical protein
MDIILQPEKVSRETTIHSILERLAHTAVIPATNKRRFKPPQKETEQ